MVPPSRSSDPLPRSRRKEGLVPSCFCASSVTMARRACPMSCCMAGSRGRGRKELTVARPVLPDGNQPNVTSGTSAKRHRAHQSHHGHGLAVQIRKRPGTAGPFYLLVASSEMLFTPYFCDALVALLDRKRYSVFTRRLTTSNPACSMDAI